MVCRARELEEMLGDGIKKVESNEIESRIVQRRGLVCKMDLTKGSQITEEDLDVLRPCPKGAYEPNDMKSIIGRVLSRDHKKGENLFVSSFVN